MALSILLPTFFFIVAGEIGIYAGAYFSLHDSAYHDSMADDKVALDALNGIYSENEYRRVDGTLSNAVTTYKENKPSEMPKEGSPEEAEYKDRMARASSGMLYYYLAADLERYVTSFVGIFYEDVESNRMVLVCSSNTSSERYSHVDKVTALYVGSFFDRTALFDGQDFYGVEMIDANLGKMLASGRFLVEAPSGNRYWLIRETESNFVYAIIPPFTRSFAIVASVFTVFLLALLFLILNFLVLRRSRRLAKKSARYVEGLAQGNTDGPFIEKDKGMTDELIDLNNTLFYTQEAIKKYAIEIQESATYKASIATELALAERIQSSMVPSAPLFGKGFAVSGYMRPAKEVGGDFFDYFRIDEDHVCFYIGDVSGKGVPAALFMARASTLLRVAGSKFDIDRANRELCHKNEQFLFVTAFIGVLEISTGTLNYVNAGHEPVYLRRNGTFIHLEEESNFMLGCIEDFQYVKQSIKLRKGDRLVMYTDGVSEATNAKGELYGKEHILETLNEHSDASIEEVSSIMFQSIKDFEGEMEQFDDACIVVVDYLKSVVLDIPANMEGMAKVAPFIDENLSGLSAEKFARIQIALDELCSNVIYYSQATHLSVSIESEPGEAVVVIEDDGIPFDPIEYNKEPDFTRPGGMGIGIVKSIAKSVQYVRKNDKNILSMTILK